MPDCRQRCPRAGPGGSPAGGRKALPDLQVQVPSGAWPGAHSGGGAVCLRRSGSWEVRTALDVPALRFSPLCRRGACFAGLPRVHPSSLLTPLSSAGGSLANTSPQGSPASRVSGFRPWCPGQCLPRASSPRGLAAWPDRRAPGLSPQAIPGGPVTGWVLVSPTLFGARSLCLGSEFSL